MKMMSSHLRYLLSLIHTFSSFIVNYWCDGNNTAPIPLWLKELFRYSIHDCTLGIKFYYWYH